MNTSTLQVFSLRGMNERWLIDPQDALYIHDMTWTLNDSWKTSGGFKQLYQPDAFVEDQPTQQSSGGTTSSTDTSVAPSLYASINSIHWFAQHNGARQWLIFETQNADYDAGSGTFIPNGTVSLKAFDGSKTKNFSSVPDTRNPEKLLIEYRRVDSSLEDYTLNVDKRSESKLAIRTQSQTYGGRIYFVNGFDEALVFDGDHCERAGFISKPPPPSALSSAHDNSTTYPFATGDRSDKYSGGEETPNPKSRGFYSLHSDVPYWGLGVRSDAEIGVGAYRFKGVGDIPYHDWFSSDISMRFRFYAGEQLNTRTCGYQYRVTYVNERGQESEASNTSSIVSVENGSGGKRKSLHGKGLISVNIPIGPKECVSRRIYRTRNVYDSNGDLYSKGDQRSFYFLKEISDNMTDVFVDGHPDTNLGALLDTLNLGNFPPRTKFLAIFKNTMFAAGHELNEVRYSAPLFPESFPEDNIISVGDDDGGPISGIRATKNALIVFKNRGIYLIKGDPMSGFFAQTLNKDIGCIAPDSIRELPGLGLVFLSDKSVYLLEGALENTGSVTSVRDIGAEIPNQLERLNMSAAIRASGEVYQKDREYWLSIPTFGSEKNNLCLIYHYEIESWSVRKDFPIDCMVGSKDHRGYLFMGSNETSDQSRAGILVYSRGFSEKGTSEFPISSEYKTVSNDYQSVFSNFRPAHVMAYAVGMGDNDMSVNYRVNRSINKARNTSQSADQQDPNDVYAIYGKAKFDTDVWAEYRPTVIRYDVSTTHVGPAREFGVTFASSSGNKIEIIGYDIEAKVGEQKNIKPLNKALRPTRR